MNKITKFSCVIGLMFLFSSTLFSQNQVAGNVLFSCQIKFEKGMTTLQTGSEKWLDIIVEIMSTNPNCWVKLDGYSSDCGDEDITVRIAMARSNAIKDYLNKKKIGPERIIARGHGAKHNVSDDMNYVEITIEYENEEEKVDSNFDVMISYEADKSDLKASTYPYLNKLAALLKEKPTYWVTIDGHTDNSRSNEASFILSQARVDGIKKYLIEKGIDASRIIARSHGSLEPLFPNTSVQNRVKNNRVEIRLCH